MFDTEFTIVVDGVLWHYGMYREYEDDNVKNFHFAWRDGEEKKTINFSPYSWVGPETLTIWVKAGCPKRADNPINGNFTPNSIRDYYENAKV